VVFILHQERGSFRSDCHVQVVAAVMHQPALRRAAFHLRVTWLALKGGRSSPGPGKASELWRCTCQRALAVLEDAPTHAGLPKKPNSGGDLRILFIASWSSIFSRGLLLVIEARDCGGRSR